MTRKTLKGIRNVLAGVCLAAVVSALPAAPVRAEVGMAFMQSVAEASARDRDVAKWYRDTGYAPVWTAPGDEARMRRAALLDAFAVAHAHALPEGKYSADKLRTMMSRAVTPRDLGRLEAELTRVYLDFATDIQTGVLVPKQVDDGIKREVPLRSVESYMTGITSPDPVGFVRGLAPRTGEYTRLLKAKLDLEYRVNHGGWGAPVPASSLKPGQEGRDVVALRNRLIAMGYLPWSVGTRYDAEMQMAVQTFQEDHGLLPDGVAGAGTMTEINVPIGERLKSVIVALERERWMNMERGKRHILVNLTDFHARIMDDDKLTFITRSVIGQNTGDRRSPEFSDEMDHLVINPTWNVPRSIATKEYLPAFKRNPYSNSHLKLYNARGQVVDRGSVNFAAYNERNFPFDVKQPPSSRNALGLVKFMFPNVYNIYLHDTPSKSLFDREARDFSHGCIRLADPFDFAYELLSRQEADPKGFFQSILQTGRETRVNLKEPVPVHLIYRTAVTDPKGRITFRRDVYGRDGRVWDALERAGVILPGGQS